MTVEELVRAIGQLSEAELQELVRRVPGLREAIEAEVREQLAEPFDGAQDRARVAYQVTEETSGVHSIEGADKAEAREVLTQG